LAGVIIAVALLITGIQMVSSGLSGQPFNVSYADWTAKWWQWAYSIPWDRNPSYDDTGKYCSENQPYTVCF
jgi:hypothetical protein